MGINEMIAHDINDFVNIAVTYANDPEKQKKISEKINENKNLVFQQKESVDEWNTLLQNLYLEYFR